jgi:hypothetical protein
MKDPTAKINKVKSPKAIQETISNQGTMTIEPIETIQEQEAFPETETIPRRGPTHKEEMICETGNNPQ